MIILGISAYYHDSSAALIIDGKIIAGAAEERFSHIKHDNSFPIQACAFCLQYAAITLADVDEIAFYEKPIVKFERILKSHILYAPKGWQQFLRTTPIWLKEKLNMRSTIISTFKRHFGYKVKNIRFVDHHLSHAANAFFQSGFETAGILVVDAVGEYSTTSIYRGSGSKIELVSSQSYPNSLGLLYSAITYYLGFQVNSDEYKVMGLAAYGKENEKDTQHFIKTISKDFISINDDGSIILNDKYFTFMYSDRMVDDEQWNLILGIDKRHPKDKILQCHKNLAYAMQFIMNEVMERLLCTTKKITECDNVCLSGGCAMNCVSNGYLANHNHGQLYVPYSPDDSGCSIGAALAVCHILYNSPIKPNNSSYIGPKYDDSLIKNVIESKGHSYKTLSDEELYKYVTHNIENHKIVGWFQGRMEFGPRALGNRSILADARNPYMKEIINEKIKHRESFRPFAPVVLEEYAHDVFEIKNSKSKHMSFTYSVKSNSYPAITHIDRSSRVQIVTKDDNKKLYDLLAFFNRETGCPLLLNTSLNVMGDPIACTPLDAITTFSKANLDILVINNFVIEKENT